VVPGRIRHDGEGRITGLADQGKVAFSYCWVLPSPRGPISTIAALAAPMACSSAFRANPAQDCADQRMA
jgi:hypothetical protein